MKAILRIGFTAILATTCALGLQPTNAFAEKVSLDADEMEWDRENNRILADQNVRVFYEGNWINADAAIYWQSKNLLEAKGNVQWGGPDGSGSATSITLDTETRQGVLLNAQMRDSSGTKAWGRRIERLGPVDYRIYDGGYTPCKCPAGSASSWKITVARADVEWREAVYFRHGTFWINEIPAVYFPVGYAPLLEPRQTGILLPNIGYSTRYGYSIRPGFFLELGPSADTTIWGEYTTLGGWGGEWETRLATRTGNTSLNVTLFQEAEDAPFLDEEDRSARRRWTVNGRVHESPWNLFRLRFNLRLISDSSLDADFANDLEDLTKSTTGSRLTLSQEWDGIGSAILLTAISQSLLTEDSTTGSRVPSLWLRLDPLGARDLPFWLDADLRYDAFYAYDGDFGEAWEPDGYDRQGNRIYAAASVGFDLDPLPGLHVRTNGTISWQNRIRDLYTTWQRDEDDSSVVVTRTTISVTNSVSYIAGSEIYYGLRARHWGGSTAIRTGVDLRWLAGGAATPWDIEDVDHTPSQLWAIPNLRSQGSLRDWTWSLGLEMPFIHAENSWQPLGYLVQYAAAQYSRYFDIASQIWFGPTRPKLRRTNLSTNIKPHRNHKLGFTYSRANREFSQLFWEVGGPTQWANNVSVVDPFHEFTVSYSWKIQRFFGRVDARRRLILAATDVPTWVSQSIQLGYKDPCNCWSAAVSVRDNPGTKADRVSLQIDLALLGSTAIGTDRQN